MVVYRTFLLAKKLLLRKDQPRILESIATKVGAVWEVNEPNESRTEIGRRSFSSRVKRLWSLLPEESKDMTIETKDQKDIAKDVIRNIDSTWILWGGAKSTTGASFSTNTTSDGFNNGDPEAEEENIEDDCY